MMDESRQGSFEFSIEWQSSAAKHKDRYYFEKMNFWRDLLSEAMVEGLKKLEPGDTFSEEYEQGKLVDSFDKNKVLKVPRARLNLTTLSEEGIFLRKGRFYPRGTFSSFGYARQDVRPVRIMDDDEGYFTMDTNHPLHAYPLTVTGKLISRLQDRTERGGNCNDIYYSLTDGGPGLQAEIPEVETDFLLDHPFERDDQSSDADFYQTPRMVNHIDTTASKNVSELYSRFIQPGMKVLDLMSSWNSHLEMTPGSIELSGIGLNQVELEKNPLLSEVIVQDLNLEPILPLNESGLDAAICTASIEYLVKPVEIIHEIARILKPGAPFVITFTDRWFPPKVINIWNELHPFERMGLVVDYLKRSEKFTDIQTESIRGYPRPDGYSSGLQRPDSDPVFAVWGYAV